MFQKGDIVNYAEFGSPKYAEVSYTVGDEMVCLRNEYGRAIGVFPNLSLEPASRYAAESFRARRDYNKRVNINICCCDVASMYPRHPGIDLTRAERHYSLFDDIMTTERIFNDCMKEIEKMGLPKIKKVIFNDPATIVFWADGTKTIVKNTDKMKNGKKRPFDPEKGLAMAISKKALGNQGNYYNEFKKWLPKEGK